MAETLTDGNLPQELEDNPTMLGSPISPVAGGLVDPLSHKLNIKELPQPPISYPPSVRPSNTVPSIPSGKINNSQQAADHIFNLGKTANQWGRNPYQHTKEKVYNAEYDGAYFQRYAAVDDVYAKKGFHPYLDNEAIYNQEATWFDYFSRSVDGAKIAFATSYKSMLPWNGWSSDNSDIKSAKELERAHALGHDTRGGVGAWVNNFTVDTGITFGILAEIGTEELAIWTAATLAAPETAGASFAAAAIETGNVVRKGVNLAKLGKKLGKTMDFLKSSDKMREVYNLAGKTAKRVGEAITPETAKVLAEGFSSLKQGEKFMDIARASKGFGALYRDSRAALAVHTEAAMEAGSSELDLRKKLLDDHRKNPENQGKEPTQDQLTNMYMEASNAAKKTYYWNLPALYLSNAIVFEKALKGWKPMMALRTELEAGIKGKLQFNQAWKAAGGKAWEVVEKSWSNTYKSLTKDGLKHVPKNSLKLLANKFAKYSLVNLTEAFQEQYQDAVQGAMKEYYADRYNHPGMEGSRSVWGSFAKSAGNTLTSAQGWNAFASGFLMGSVVQAPQKLAFEWAPMQFKKITDKEGYKTYMDRMEKNTNNVVDALNAATMDDKFFDSITENAVHQMNANQDAENANSAGDKHTFYDITDDSVFNHIHTLMRTGKIDLLRDQIKDYKGLTKQDLEEAYGPTSEEEGDSYAYYQKRFDGMINKIDLIEKNYQELEKVHNIFNPSKYNKEKNPEAYLTELDNYHMVEEAKKTALYSNYKYARAIDRMQGLMRDLTENKPISEAAAADFTLLLNPVSYDRELGILEDEVKAFKEGGKESVEKAYESQKKLNRLRKYKDAADKVRTALDIDSRRQAGVDGEAVTAAQAEGKIIQGTTVKNKKGNEHTVDYITKGVAYNKKGEKIGKLKDLEILGGASEADFLENAFDDLFKAYSGYLKEVAKDKKAFVRDRDIMSSFEKLKDMFKLKQDADDMGLAADILHNPRQLLDYAARGAQIAGEMRAQQREKIEASYRKYLESMRGNELLTELYRMGVFLDEEGVVEALDYKIPSKFYDISSKDEIDPSSQKYKDIMDLFEKFEDTSQQKFTEKPIPEAEVTPDMLRYSAVTRNKINNDRRTFKDHAAYWGFNEDPAKSSTVNTREVLNKILKSEFATSREKQLARRLLGLISKESVVTFTKLGNPGEFRHTEEDKIGTFIDARYMSDEYMGGKKTPIEAIILHELIHEITSVEMAKDPEFSAAITKLLKAAQNAYAKAPPTDTTLYEGGTRREFYGLKNEQEFLAELFSNDRFRTWLNTIEYESTGTTLWTEFLDKLKSFLARILGVRADGTLLDEAMNIATQYIDRSQGLTPAQQEVASRGGLTFASPIESYKTAGILPDMIKAYKKFVQRRIGKDRVTAEEWMDPEAATKTDDQIAASDGFRKYLNTRPIVVRGLFDTINSKTQPVQAPVAPVVRPPAAPVVPPPASTAGTFTPSTPYGTPTGPTLTTSTDEQEVARLRAEEQAEYAAMTDPNDQAKKDEIYDKYDLLISPILARIDASKTQPGTGEVVEKASLAQQRLLVNDLGYTYDEAGQFTAEEAVKILDENITKAQKQAAQQRAEEAEKALVAQGKENQMRSLEADIDAVEFIEDFKAVEKKIGQAMAEDPLAIDTDRLDARIEARKQELATNLKFEDIQEGNGVIMRDDYNNKMVVVAKDDIGLYLRRYDQPETGNVTFVPKDQVREKVLYKHQPSVATMIIAEPVTEQAQQAANENQQSVQQPTDAAEIADDIQQASTMTDAEIEDEFNDNLGCL
jgi:hypothetical protein